MIIYFLGLTCYTPSPFTSSDVIWSLQQNNIVYLTTYIENLVVNNRPCFVQGIIGNRSAIGFSANLKQYVTRDYPFDFRNVSFSITAWIYLTSGQSSMTIFTQCDTQVQDNCLFLRIKNQQILIGFPAAGAHGGTTLDTNRWYHVAFAYNDTSQRQIVYLDGVEDSSDDGHVYLGDPSNITIGYALQSYETYFDGLIDRISLLSQTMTDDEVLEEATLTAYYSFDNSIEIDSGPNQINGFGYNVNLGNGMYGQGLSFTTASSGSYFQAKNFLLLGMSNYSYSFSFWIIVNEILAGGSIIYITSDNGWCLPMLGFNADNNITAQSSNGNIQEIVGSQLANQTWIHIALTYEYGNNLTLYQDGLLIGTTGPFVYASSGLPVTLTLGYTPSQTSCQMSSIVPGNINGRLDEFRIYSRCLTDAEILIIKQLG